MCKIYRCICVRFVDVLVIISSNFVCLLSFLLWGLHLHYMRLLEIAPSLLVIFSIQFFFSMCFSDWIEWFHCYIFKYTDFFSSIMTIVIIILLSVSVLGWFWSFNSPHPSLLVIFFLLSFLAIFNWISHIMNFILLSAI